MANNKKAAGFSASIISCVLTVVALVLYYLNATGQYYNDLNNLVLILYAAGIVALLLGIATAKAPTLSGIFRIAAPVLIMAAALLFLNGRVYSYAIIFASDLESGNAAASSAAVQSIVAAAIYALAALIAAIGAFMNVRKAA